MSADPDEPKPVTLKVLQDTLAPVPVLDGWKRLTRFPNGALEQWWTLLEPAVTKAALLEDGVRVAQFAQLFALRHDDVALAVQASAFLVTQAVALNLEPDLLKADLELISGQHLTAASQIVEGYEKRREDLRELILEWSLHEHGSVLEGVDWRVDQITASSHGKDLDAPIVLMTLKYRDANDSHRLTLQLTSTAMEQLQAFVRLFEN
jgi:hypothetical protein